MKTLHLVCNSHLDPVWQWNWDEGATAALATFYAACNLLDQYDYVFCHNEVILYEFIEKYDKALFERIQKLVKEGKWVIMGGWYCQPDCIVPSGESFIRQITLGREYFMEKFASKPHVAVNFDAFAHTRGLVQILDKTGYEGYVFCRPMKWLDNTVEEVPFYWTGYDGSKIRCLIPNSQHIYCSPVNKAKEFIIEKSQPFLRNNQEQGLALWGVGNHGGVESAKDLEDIMVLTDEKKGEYNIVHSTLEAYFNSIEEPNVTTDREFYTFRKSMSSVNEIKRRHDELENAIYSCEKVCTVADLLGTYSYDKEAFKYAERVLAQSEFHDVLSGTAVKTGYDSTYRKIDAAIEKVKQEFYSAVQSMSIGYKATKPNDYSFIVFNHQPYAYETNIEVEIFAVDPAEAFGNKSYKVTVYDENDNVVTSQILKEESDIDIDRRKRLVLKANLPALGSRKFGVHLDIVDRIPTYEDKGEEIVVEDEYKKVSISRKTGLINSYVVKGKEYLNGNALQPVMFEDNEDPWGWYMDKVGFKHSEIKLDKGGKGMFKKLQSVKVLKDGDICTEVQSIFTRGESHLVYNYKLYKNAPYVDVNVHVIWNAYNSGLKLKTGVKGKKQFFAQTAYGIDYRNPDGKEVSQNRYIGNEVGSDALVIYNKSGVHACSKEGKSMYMTLLNGSCYCAHPTKEFGKRILPDETRFIRNIETGTHDFAFRLSVNAINECEKLSQEFNYKPYVNEYYPHGDGNVPTSPISISNPNIVITALKKRKYDGYLFRVYNGSKKNASTIIKIDGKSKKITLKKYEFKTYTFDGKVIEEACDSSIY